MPGISPCGVAMRPATAAFTARAGSGLDNDHFENLITRPAIVVPPLVLVMVTADAVLAIRYATRRCEADPPPAPIEASLVHPDGIRGSEFLVEVITNSNRSP